MAAIRVIIAGVADSHAHDPTLAAAVALARRTGAELHVVHAFPLPGLLSMTPGMEYIEPWSVAEYAASVTATFHAAVRQHYPVDRLSVHAVPGTADRALLENAERLRADLVVVGATRRGRIARALLGTTAQRVLRGSPAPVLVVRAPVAEAGRVLLTTDLSSTAGAVHERGLDVAEAVFGTPEARLLLVIMEGVSAPIPRETLERVARAEVAEFLEDRRSRGAGPEVALRFGLPADEIVAEAERWSADLVVLGTHNRAAVPRILLGSVAEAALRRLQTNVLVIPPAATLAGDAPRAAGAAGSPQPARLG